MYSHIKAAEPGPEQMALFYRSLISAPQKRADFFKLLEKKDEALFQQLAVQFADQNRAELVQKVTVECFIADDLCGKKVIHSEMYSKIMAAEHRESKMRLLYTAVNGSKKGKTAFFKLLVQEELPLIQDLAMKQLQLLEACD
ncbi:hypothetical protein SKAU_G00377960 [Synaphobranchus kaupii]|uniref:CARD domain-containing protein n=1 Tax=Synaphobranchus kaupii TaxID=118154 RepID=A0A9Q1ED36_SYNKA|nr:hypothetical protein SKAU_G00377960 [Synaphobranchus kaupii]